MNLRTVLFVVLLFSQANWTAIAKAERNVIGPDAPIERQFLKLHGDPARPVTLKTTLVMPPGAEPFPSVIFNHGSSGIPKFKDMHT